MRSVPCCPTASDLIGAAFGVLRDAAPPGAGPLDEDEVVFRACLEDAVQRFFSPYELQVLHAERECDPEGAAARITGAAGLLRALPEVFADPAWWGADAVTRRFRIPIAEHLLLFVSGFPPVADAGLEAVTDRAEACIERARRRYGDLADAGL